MTEWVQPASENKDYQVNDRKGIIRSLKGLFERRANQPGDDIDDHLPTDSPNSTWVMKLQTEDPKSADVFHIDQNTGVSTYAAHFYSRTDGYVLNTNIYPRPSFPELRKNTGDSKTEIGTVLAETRSMLRGR